MGGSILVVAGTHGNECNAPWLLQQWRRQPDRLHGHGLALQLVLGNPPALAAGRRYCDRDLNRCFSEALLHDPGEQSLEVCRARELLDLHGPSGSQPALVAIDLHSTTAAMGNSLVVYGRRPADLALAAGIQARLGLPVYLHEADAAQSGFLVERWPCGLVIEAGPVPQGVVQARICRQTQLALEHTIAVLAAAAQGSLRLPAALAVHRHLTSVDLPRHGDGTAAAWLHPQLQGADWRPLRPADPAFLLPDGQTLSLQSCLPAQQARLAQEPLLWPVFVNEAAYGEKGIAFSLTRLERWPVEPGWGEALASLAGALQRADG
jgi:aspartoacylase